MYTRTDAAEHHPTHKLPTAAAIAARTTAAPRPVLSCKITNRLRTCLVAHIKLILRSLTTYAPAAEHQPRHAHIASPGPQLHQRCNRRLVIPLRLYSNMLAVCMSAALWVYQMRAHDPRKHANRRATQKPKDAPAAACKTKP
jgi:hypothetical protein